jgi:hypothetical protein
MRIRWIVVSFFCVFALLPASALSQERPRAEEIARLVLRDNAIKLYELDSR